MKEFESDPRVVLAVMSQNESKDVLETFWLNVFLRGTMIYDPNGSVAQGLYGQPAVELPASRWFVIGPDQTVVAARFGHDPVLAIETIEAVLDSMEGSGDFDDDGAVDADDFDAFDACFTGGGGGVPPGCEPGDLDGDQDVDCDDFYDFVLAWTPAGPLPAFPQCPAAIVLQPDASQFSWAPIAGALAYDVVRGDLIALRTAAGGFDAAVSGCVVDDTPVTSVDLGPDPAPGRVDWYAVRAVVAAGPATYDSLMPSQVGRRDAPIDSTPAACP